MLADLGNPGCPPLAGYHGYHHMNRTAVNKWTKVLESAKTNLMQLAYFGLTEYQELSAELFEWTFNLNFKYAFQQHNTTRAQRAQVPDRISRKIAISTQFENRLYEFAENLFLLRVDVMKRQKKTPN